MAAKVDTIVNGGRSRPPASSTEAGLAILGEKIVVIGPPAWLPPAGREIDAMGKVVLPRSDRLPCPRRSEYATGARGEVAETRYREAMALVGRGAVASLARPGGNSMAGELETKRLELLKGTVPAAVRVACLWTASVTNVDPWLVRSGVGAAARTLGVQLQHVGARDASDLDAAVSNDPFQYAHRARIAELAIKDRLPAMYEGRDYPDVGGLISYGVYFPDLFRRAAGYVDKVLKGAKRADLPVEQATKFEMVINLKTAKALGLTISPAVLARADEVINRWTGARSSPVSATRSADWQQGRGSPNRLITLTSGANGLLNLEALCNPELREIGYVEKGSGSMNTLYSILSAILVFILLISPLAARAGAPWDRQINNSHRFRVLREFGGAAVLDRETGLVWERSPDVVGHIWMVARGICIDKNVGGRKGWRLPSFTELASLVDPNNVDPTAVNPALPPDHPFSNVHPFSYWSATTVADSPTLAWNVFFGDGLVFGFNKVGGSFLWCVRGGMNADQY